MSVVAIPGIFTKTNLVPYIQHSSYLFNVVQVQKYIRLLQSKYDVYS